MNADLFFLLALQQTLKGENSELALSAPLSCMVPLHTNPCLTQATDPPGGLGAEENLLKSLIAGVDVSAAKQPLLSATAAADSLNGPCCCLRPVNSCCCHSF